MTDYKTLFPHIDPEKPVAFLDIDGVLNGGFQHDPAIRSLLGSLQTLRRPEGNPGDTVLLYPTELLRKIFERFGVQVIITSSWMGYDEDYDHPETRMMGDFLGMDIHGSVNTSGSVERGFSVKEAIEALGLNKWLIIDDCHHFYRPAGLSSLYIVKPDGRYGLQAEEFEQIFLLLSDMT